MRGRKKYTKEEKNKLKGLGKMRKEKMEETESEEFF